MKKIFTRFLALIGLTLGLSVAVNVEDTYAFAGSGVISTLASYIQGTEGFTIKTMEIETTVSRESATEALEIDGQIGIVNDGTLYGYKELGIANVDTYLNVRDKASEYQGEIVGKLPKGAGCEILDKKKNGWYKIKSGKVTGYVSGDWLLTGEAAEKKARETAYTVATVNTTTLFVRMEPNTECKILTMVPITEELYVLEVLDNGWCKIELDDEEGYVCGDYVILSEQLPHAMTLKELHYNEGVSNTRVDLVAYALQFVGNKYVWGGTSLTNGVDCSGFTMQVYAHFGVTLPHYSGSQAGYGTSIKSSEAQPGDLFFYGSGGKIGHVGIYIGNGQIVHASNARDGIKISNAFYRTPLKVISLL